MLIGCILGVFVLVSLVTLLFMCIGRDGINGNKLDGGGHIVRASDRFPRSHINAYRRPKIGIGTYAYYWKAVNDIIERFTSRVRGYYADTVDAGYDFKNTIGITFDESNGSYGHDWPYSSKANTPVTSREKNDIEKVLRQYRAYSRTVLRLLDNVFVGEEQRIPMNVLLTLIKDPDLCTFNTDEIVQAAVVINEALNA